MFLCKILNLKGRVSIEGWIFLSRDLVEWRCELCNLQSQYFKMA